MSNTEIMPPEQGLAKAQETGEPRTAMVEVAASQAAQEVQARMIVAKNCPRDETAAFNRVIKACKRRTLAEQAMYVYPRGGSTITGPSIRLAEVLAQNWGNMEFGIVEVEQRYGESTMLAYAWDQETNCRQQKVFTVKHVRHTRKGSYKLEDPRDIYEMTANQGARRMRACILGVIPGDLVDAALAECEKTMAGGNAEPLSDRVRKMVVAFSEHGVSQEAIERRLGHRIEATIEPELVMLRKAYTSIKDNMASVHDLFPPPAETNDNGPQKPGSEALADKLEGDAARDERAKEAAGEMFPPDEKPKPKGK